MSKAFKYYYDLMSQPSRALWIALKYGKTPYEDCPVALRKREHTTEEFKKINRFGQLPCIVDNDFHLSESVSIGQFSPSLYPKDLKPRSRVDEFLEWQHLALRFGCSKYAIIFFMEQKPSDMKIDLLRQNFEDNLKLVDKIWLNQSKFLTGDQLTVADLFGACEIEQTKLVKYNVAERFPRVSEWLENVRQETNPYYDEAHTYLYKKSGVKNNE